MRLFEVTFFRGLYIGQSRVGNHRDSERHSSEYRQINYIHLVKLKLLLQSMQVLLEPFAGKVHGMLSFFNGHFLVRLMLKAKKFWLEFSVKNEPEASPEKPLLLLALMVRSWSKWETGNAILKRKYLSASVTEHYQLLCKTSIRVNKCNSNNFVAILTGWQNKWSQIDVKYSEFWKIKVKNCKNLSLILSS